MVIGILSCLALFVQDFLWDRRLQALSSLINLRELSLSGAWCIDGTGLAYLTGLSNLQVRLLDLQPQRCHQTSCSFSSVLPNHNPFPIALSEMCCCLSLGMEVA